MATPIRGGRVRLTDELVDKLLTAHLLYDVLMSHNRLIRHQSQVSLAFAEESVSDYKLQTDFYKKYLVVVVSQCSAQFVVIHVVFVLAKPPQARNLLSIQQLELSILAGPGDQMTLSLVLQQVKQELPECDGRVHGCDTHRQTMTLKT